MCDVAPVTSVGGDDTRIDETRLSLAVLGAKWTCLWRSLALSSIGKTAYPYCRYLRALDLRDLEQLFQEPRFHQKYGEDFFAGDLASFLIEEQSMPQTRAKSARRFNVTNMLDKIGDSITKSAPMLEELAGPASHEALLRWAPCLGNLQQLRLWDGSALVNTGSIITVHCPRFTLLKFYNWLGDSTDASFAAFLLDLRPNSLESVEIFGGSHSGTQVTSALSHHSQSLVELKLGQVNSEVFSSLPTLSSPTGLKVLHLSGFRGNVPVPKEVWNEISTWLRSCTSLIDVSLLGSSHCHQILTPFLLDPKIRLSKLEIEYFSTTATAFHSALAHQSSSLTSLILRAEGDGFDVNPLVKSLTSLTNLLELRLFGVSDYFRDQHIISIANSIPMLEELSISGWAITDAVWPALGSLKSMRRLDLNAVSVFTLEGILGYIDGLGKGNWGLSLAIMMADPEYALQEEEQALAKEVLANKVEGRFDYTLSRGKIPFPHKKGAGVKLNSWFSIAIQRPCVA